MHKEEYYYLLKWKDWPSEYNSYVLEDDMNAPAAIAAFEKAQKKRTGVNKQRGPRKK